MNLPLLSFAFKPCFLSVVNLVIFWSLLCFLLLYKRLPSKVTPLSLVLNVYFIGEQLFSEGKLYLSTSLISSTTLHIEIISLVDGTYELIQEPDGNISEAQTNTAELTEVLNLTQKNQNPLTL